MRTVVKFFGLVRRFIVESIFLLERGAKEFEKNGEKLNKKLKIIAAEKRAVHQQRREQESKD